MEFTRRKKIVLLGLLALIAVVGVANNKLSNDQNLAASAEYTEYEMQQINKHDGDVLVDSLSLSQVPGSSTDAALEKNESTDEGAAESDAMADGALDSSVIVTSDNYADLANADTYFEEKRATINMDRNQVISMLTDVIAETKDGPEKNNATQQKLKIIEYMEKERTIENLIENKGFPETLVLMTDNSITVTVNKQEITQSDVAKICDIVMRETGRSAGQIVIQSKF
ncbi:MAG: SpoIIIAH-like family protein [Anaerovoracaceae bacterium]|jgi:stage III sporulation protein AH